MTLDLHHVRRITIKRWELGKESGSPFFVLVLEIEDVQRQISHFHLFTTTKPEGDFPRVLYDADHATPILFDATATVSHIDPVTVMPVEVTQP